MLSFYWRDKFFVEKTIEFGVYEVNLWDGRQRDEENIIELFHILLKFWEYYFQLTGRWMLSVDEIKDEWNILRWIL